MNRKFVGFPIVGVVHDDISASILFGVKDSN